MKIIWKTAVFFAIFSVACHTARSQATASKRPQNFARYADQLPADEAALENAFSVPEGGKLIIKFGDLSFKGIVTSSIRRYDNLQSIVVRSADLNNTLLALSRRVNDDKSVSYVGRIINQQYADGFELRKAKNAYELNKINTDALIEDF